MEPPRNYREKILTSATDRTFNMVVIRNDLLKAMSKHKVEGLLLQDLINLAADTCDEGLKEYFRSDPKTRREVRDMSKDGYFKCSSKDLVKLLWKENEQRKYLKNLVSLGLIYIKRRGVPATRWIKIRIDKVHDLTKSTSGRGLWFD